MGLWEWLADSAGLLLVLVVLYGLALVLRRRLLGRHGGTFELSVRVRPGDARGWVLGLGRYTDEEIEWFRIFTLSPRPKRTWPRRDLEYVGQREAAGAERLTLYTGHLVVRCRTRTGEVEMAMSPSALTGLQAWLEAAPPGASTRPER